MIFKGKNAIAERCSEMFTQNTNGNYEATPSLVAISCAAIWSALQDWSTGKLHATDSDEKWFKDVYGVHRSILEKLKTSKPDQYHRTMEHIFAEAVAGIPFSQHIKTTKSSLIEQEAMLLFEQAR
ncbi:hypothetical protein C8R45DRAFT_1095378 [Mycena sanguinolenta]|nr:hypothetical protein C8R45DRAFT_1095378 [Mycena sanguinolenta]